MSRDGLPSREVHPLDEHSCLYVDFPAWIRNKPAPERVESQRSKRKGNTEGRSLHERRYKPLSDDAISKSLRLNAES